VKVGSGTAGAGSVAVDEGSVEDAGLLQPEARDEAISTTAPAVRMVLKLGEIICYIIPYAPESKGSRHGIFPRTEKARRIQAKIGLGQAVHHL
jgi:hypothetical protein